MANLLSASPILILLLGGITLIPVRRVPRLLLFWPLLVFALSLVTLLIASRQPDPTLLVGQAGADDSNLRFQYAPIAVLLSGLVLGAGVVWHLLQSLSGGLRWQVGAFIALAGAVAFLLADNWSTLIAAWLLTDLGLLGWRLAEHSDSNTRTRAWRGFGIGLFGALVLLGLAALLVSQGGSLALESRGDGLVLTLGIVAAWMRAGLYPFHSFTRRITAGAKPDQTAAAERGFHPATFVSQESVVQFSDDLPEWALSAILGGYFLVRVLGLSAEPPVYGLILLAAVLVSLGLTLLLALIQPEARGRTAWAAQSVGLALLVIPFLGARPAQPAFALWLALGLYSLLVLIFGVRLLRGYTRRWPWVQVLWGVALLCAAGFPLSPAFMGRVGLYAAALQSGQPLWLVVLPAALTIGLVPVWFAFADAKVSQERRPTWMEYIGLALLFVPILLQGVLPFAIAALVSPGLEDASAFAYDALAHPANALQPVILVLAVLLPVPLSFVVARRSVEYDERLVGAQRLVSALDVTTVGSLVTSSVDNLVLLLRQVSTLVEQHPLGWVLFAAIWVALWLLNVRV